MRVKLKSAYLPYDSKDGARYLAETTWPEGVDTYRLSPYLWVHELAPSYDLKEMGIWKHWSPEKFKSEYRQQLREPQNRDWFELLLIEAREKGVTLLHQSHKSESQIAPIDTTVYFLKEFLDVELNKWPELSQPQTLSAAVPRSGIKTYPAVERWANEGGK